MGSDGLTRGSGVDSGDFSCCGDAELYLMRAAIKQAKLALRHDDVPVGALVVDSTGQVIASAHNERELRGDPTAHAELLALRQAAKQLGSWRLDGCTLVVTLEPCPMCAGALLAARLDRLVFGAYDPKAGACGSLYNIVGDPRMNHEVAVLGAVLAGDTGALLTEFFQGRRIR